MNAIFRRLRLLRSRLRKAAFCTIATESYLPWTLVLFDAVKQLYPGAPRVLLYVRAKDEPGRLPQIEGVHVAGIEDLADPAHEAGLRRKYNLAELCYAFKPRLLAYCLDRFGERAYYLDSDLCLVSRLDEAAIALEHSSIVVTPHLDAPLPIDGRLPTELTVSRAGFCNAGFIGVAEGGETRDFLAWWDTRVARWGFVAPEFGYQGDQKWLDLAPSLFPGVHLLRDPGSNVGSWNLHGRPIERGQSGVLTVHGRPLAFFHFSGFDVERPEVLSKYQNRVRLPDHPALAELARRYAGGVVGARQLAAAIAWTARPLRQVATAEAGESTHAPEPMADEDYRAAYEVEIPPGSYESLEEIPTRVVVTNASARRWRVGRAPDGSGGIALSWHLLNHLGGMLQWENDRHFLPHDLEPGASVEMRIGIRAMPVPGRYILQFDLVQEGITWFLPKGSGTTEVRIFVGLFE